MSKSHESDNFRYLDNRAYNVLLGMNKVKARNVWNTLVRAGYSIEAANKVIESAFQISLRDDTEPSASEQQTGHVAK